MMEYKQSGEREKKKGNHRQPFIFIMAQLIILLNIYKYTYVYKVLYSLCFLKALSLHVANDLVIQSMQVIINYH